MAEEEKHFLDDFLEGQLEFVAGDVRCNLTLMSELDNKLQAVMRRIDINTPQFLKDAGRRGRNPLAKTIWTDVDACLDISDQKLVLASDAYERVDFAFRLAGETLRKFDHVIRKKEQFEAEHYGTVPLANPDKGAWERHRLALQKKKKKRRIRDVYSDEDDYVTPAPDTRAASRAARRRGQRERKVSQAALRSDLEIYAGGVEPRKPPPVEVPPPITPKKIVDPSPRLLNEAVYCVCRGVSYGEMVGCDHPKCEVEWFHFTCMGLKEKPSGKWLCPLCTKRENNRRRR